MMNRREYNRRLRFLLSRPHAERMALLAEMTEQQQREFQHVWRIYARNSQVAPDSDWRTWLILAGRGFGKTRAGSEWVRELAEAQPGARIALIGATLAEARSVMVEGESGILAICPPDRCPQFEPSLRRLSWPNGAEATLYSAGEPESLRGPQHGYAWCDEVAKWDNANSRAMRAWDNLQFGLRLGELPRCLATTTPRAVPLVRKLTAVRGGDIAISGGSTEDNTANLSARFLRDIRTSYGKTALGRQELDGELLEDIEGALWTRAMLEGSREDAPSSPLVRTVVAVDPPVSGRGDACGIVVCALGEDGIGRVLADCSLEKPSPERWARKVAQVAESWAADRVVAEANQGGDMVASVLRAADISLPLKLVHASKGKVARAEPVAALYETGRIRHVGLLAKLEDQLCGMLSGGGYQGPGRSPDRADALVWAVTELMLGKRGVPKIRTAG